MDKILEKYHTMGDEIDKIYVQLKGYESEIKQSNRKLNTMFEANVNFYHELVKYILAGEQACKELEAYIAQRKNDMETTGDQSIQFELTSLNQALMMMEQRTQDLRTAENVAMQSIPMIKTMEFSNYNLVRKINSAFIVTLPVFKQALAQAILLKRQKLQAEAMSELDKKTNEMLIKNAQNTVDVSKVTLNGSTNINLSVNSSKNNGRYSGISVVGGSKLEANEPVLIQSQLKEKIDFSEDQKIDIYGVSAGTYLPDTQIASSSHCGSANFNDGLIVKTPVGYNPALNHFIALHSNNTRRYSGEFGGIYIDNRRSQNVVQIEGLTKTVLAGLFRDSIMQRMQMEMIFSPLILRR